MRVQPAVKAEIKKMALGVSLLTVLMLAVFLIIGKFDLTVLFGAILGCGSAIGNFFLMALTVQKITDDMPVLSSQDTDDEASNDDADDADAEKKEQPISDEARQAGKKMQLSYTLRMFLLAGIAALAVASPVFHTVSALIPMLFPRIVIALQGLFGKKEQKEG